jgi:hypothetical protein
MQLVKQSKENGDPESKFLKYLDIKMKYETKDSGKREEFSSGAKRDTQENKPRYDLISPLALTRLAGLMARGAQKYDEWNWSKGMPISRFYSSALRHLMQFAMGDKSEDHLAAVMFNVMAIIHFEEINREDLNDMPEWKKY